MSGLISKKECKNEEKRMLSVVVFLVIAILVYVKFESIIKANTEEKRPKWSQKPKQQKN